MRVLGSTKIPPHRIIKTGWMFQLLQWMSAQSLAARGPLVVCCNEKHNCCISFIMFRFVTAQQDWDLLCRRRYWRFFVGLICQSQLKKEPSAKPINCELSLRIQVVSSSVASSSSENLACHRDMAARHFTYIWDMKRLSAWGCMYIKLFAGTESEEQAVKDVGFCAYQAATKEAYEEKKMGRF